MQIKIESWGVYMMCLQQKNIYTLQLGCVKLNQIDYKKAS